MHIIFEQIEQQRNDCKVIIDNDFGELFTEFDENTQVIYNFELLKIRLISLDKFYLFIKETNISNPEGELLNFLDYYYKVIFTLKLMFSKKSDTKTKDDLRSLASDASMMLDNWLRGESLLSIPFASIENSEKKKLSYLKEVIQTMFENESKDFNKKVTALESSIKDSEEKVTRFGEFIDSKVNDLKFAVSRENISTAKSENQSKIKTWGIVTVVACVILILYIVFTYCQSEEIFAKAACIKKELRLVYILKNSLLSVSIFGVLTYLLTTCIGLLKSYMNIDTIYSHKLALLNSFDDLTGADNLSNERSKIVEKLINQIIESDNININHSNSSSNQSLTPSIIQTISEKIPNISDK